MFAWRILNLPVDNIYRKVFVLRLIKIIYSRIYLCESPVAEFVNLCHKYNVLGKVTNLILLSDIPCKSEWSRYTKGLVKDRQLLLWRRTLKMYSNLIIHLEISYQYEKLCWVDLSKHERHLRDACNTITRLICGNCSLAMYKYHTPELKICKYCNINDKECLFHFIMICEKFSDDRKFMFDKIYYSVKQVTKDILINIPPKKCTISGACLSR